MIKIDEADPIGEVDPSFPYRNVTIRRNTDMKQFYDLQKEIGRGKFGTVYRCTEKSTGLKLAAKFIGISKRQDRRNAEREVDIMRELQHPRLIQMYDAFEINNIMCVVLELIEGGELFERVIDDDFILTEKSVSVFMRQICEGIAFIHSKNILHLDMKPENILCLTRTGNRIKIIDFGLARKYDPEKKLQVLFGTPEFVAPEVVNFDSIGFGTDMWSVGVICYVLISGLSPFMGETDVQTMANVTIAQYDFDDEAFNDISVDAKDFIGKLLLKDREQRMSATECLSHRWLQRRKHVSDVTPSSNPIPQSNELDFQRDTLRNLVDRWNNETNISLVVNNNEKCDQVVDICKTNGIAKEQSKLEKEVMREITNLHPIEEQKKLTLKIEEIKNADELQTPSPVPKKQLKLENELLPMQCVDPSMVTSKFVNPLSNGVTIMDTQDSEDPELENKETGNIGRKTSKSPTPLRNIRKMSKSPTPISSAANTLGENGRKMCKSPTPSSSVPNSSGEYNDKVSKSPSPTNFNAGSVGENSRNVSKSPTTLSPFASTLGEHDRRTSKSPSPLNSVPSSPGEYDGNISKSPPPWRRVNNNVGENSRNVSKSPTTLSPFASTLGEHDKRTSKSPSPLNSVPSSPGEYDGNISKSPPPWSFVNKNAVENGSRNVSKSPTTLSPFASTLGEHDRRTSKSPSPLSSVPSSPGEYDGKISKSPSPFNFVTNKGIENSKNILKYPTPVRPVASTLADYERKTSKSPTPLSSVPNSPEECDGKISKSLKPSSFVPINTRENHSLSKSPTLKISIASDAGEHDRKLSKSPTPQISVNGTPDRKISKSPTLRSSLFSSPGENNRKTSKSPSPLPSFNNKFGEYVRKTSKSPVPHSSTASSPSGHEQPIFSISLNSSSDSLSTASESGTNQKVIDAKKESNDTARELLESETNVSKANSCDNTKKKFNSDATRQPAPKVVNTCSSPPPQCSNIQENKPVSNSSDEPNDIPNRDKPALRTPTVEISDESYQCVKKRRFVIKSVQSKETLESTKNLQHDKPSCSRTSPSRRSPIPVDEDQSRTQRKIDDFASPSELMKRRISDISTFLKSDRPTIDQSISEEMSSFCNRLNRIVRLRHDSYSIDSDGMSSKRPKFRLSYFSRDVPLATTPPYHADLLNYLPLCDETITTPVWSFQKNNPFHSDPSSLRNSPERFATPSLTKKILSKFFNDSLDYDISSTPSTSNGLPKDKITGIIS